MSLLVLFSAPEKRTDILALFKKSIFLAEQKENDDWGARGGVPPPSGRIYKNSGRIYKICTCRPKRLASFEDFYYICSQITNNNYCSQESHNTKMVDFTMNNILTI